MRKIAMVMMLALATLGAGCSDDDHSRLDRGVLPPDASVDQAPPADVRSPDLQPPDTLSPDTGFVCSPPAQPGEIFALSASTGVRDISLCEYRGRVLLIVNIAAKCGYTPQLGKLATLYKTYRAQGLTVLGFYSNQFNQAGSEQEQQACEVSYGVTFPTFPNVAVNPPGEDPVFTWLKSQPGGDGPVLWNFEKFLVSRDGKLLQRWATAVEPDAPQVITAIQGALQSTP
jgi:glutathione peroxidase